MTCCGPNGRLGKPRPMKKGEPGKSTYDIWLELGNVGTKNQFLASLKGKDGKDGVVGVVGVTVTTEPVITNTVI